MPGSWQSPFLPATGTRFGELSRFFADKTDPAVVKECALQSP